MQRFDRSADEYVITSVKRVMNTIYLPVRSKSGRLQSLGGWRGSLSRNVQSLRIDEAVSLKSSRCETHGTHRCHLHPRLLVLAQTDENLN